MTQDYVSWCMKKAEVALRNRQPLEVKNYLELARLWLDKTKPDEGVSKVWQLLS